jgi:NAD(P)-dependent dehydrogenase (short-subunit alcohol dehydrogenase family)
MPQGLHLDFSGRVALITGGASGIGHAAARLMLDGGAKLAIVDIDGDAAGRAAAAFGDNAIGVQADISNAEAVGRMVSDVEARLGPADILVNSAAILDDKTFLDSTPADWDRMMSVCLHGPMLLLHAVLPGMAARGYGRVVCLASDAARLGQARLSYYAAAKAGVIALVKSVAQELGGKGVTLNIVSPGATNTPMRMRREDGMRAAMGEERYARRQAAVLKGYPVGRLGEPEDAAAAVAFLASDHAAWITGQVLSVNGGYVMP